MNWVIDLYDIGGKCAFRHDDIDTLYGVPPMPIADLPKTCGCGRALTYAAEVVFVNRIEVPMPNPCVEIDIDTPTKKDAT